MNTHLTDEHFADLLAGEEPDSSVAFHLRACETCRREITSLRRAAADFNALSMDWALVQAPRRIAIPTRFERLLGRGRPLWGIGLATALVAGIVTSHLPSSYSGVRETDPVVARTTGSAPSELAADNRLMQSIDQELQSSSQPAVPLAELRASAEETAQPTSAIVAN